MNDLDIEIDTGVCNGYGNCVVAAPGVFDIDPDTNMAFVAAAVVPPERRAAVDEAAADCPVRAIRIRNA